MTNTQTRPGTLLARCAAALGLSLFVPISSVAVLAARTACAQDVSISDHEGRWEMAYGEVFFRVNGHVANHGDVTVESVRVEIEFLDATGKTVHSVNGYNQGAEILEDVEGLDTGLSQEQKRAMVTVIAAGANDLFRIGVSKTDFPAGARFATYRIRTLEPIGEFSAATRTVTNATLQAKASAANSGTAVNTATADVLQQVPGLTEAMAKAIVSQRAKTGPFMQLEELETVAQVKPALATVWEHVSLD